MVVAIGISRDGEDGWETRLLSAAGLSAPRVLFLPTGTKDSPEYAAEARQGFLGAGAVSFEALLLTANPSAKAVDRVFAEADLVFFGGGAAPLIVKHGDRYGLKERLSAAEARGAVLAGTSGGAVALFTGGAGAYNGYRPLPGWGLAPGGVLPHFSRSEEEAAPWFAEHPNRVLYGLEDGGVLSWNGLRMTGSGAWRLTWDGKRVSREPVLAEFEPGDTTG